MKVQEFIFKNGLDALTEQYGVEVKRYDNGYVQLNYSQIDSPKMVDVVDECRALTLLVNADNTSKVIGRGFKRFYNFGEANTKDFDFSNAIAWEKADGSLTLVRWSPLDNKWIIGTRGMAYAEGNFVFSMTASGGTFYDWILKAFGVGEDQFQEAFADCDRGCTYVFEYTAPENRVVTRYMEPKMVLLAVIENDTGKEEAIGTWQTYFSDSGLNVRLPKSWAVGSSDEVVKLIETLDVLEEGFVVYDCTSGNRVKIKSAAYVAVHHLRGNGTPSMSRLMEVVLMNEQDELIEYFPEFASYVDPIVEALHQLNQEADYIFNTNKGAESQKDFALAVKDSRVAAICFKARKENVTAHRAFETMEMSQQVKLLEKFV